MWRNNPSVLIETSATETPQNCHNHIEHCIALKTMVQITEQLPSDRNELDVMRLLNSFHHLLLVHSADYDFAYIYDRLNKKCDAMNCHIIRRYYGTNTQHITQQLLDQIHCHYIHSYDIGFKLTSTESKEIEKIDDRKQQQRFIKLRNILLRKRRIRQTICPQKSRTDNKFSSPLQQLSIHDKLTKYSYSFPFNYWDKCKNSHENAKWFLSYSELYVPAKYRSLKDELINNQMCSISLQSWNMKMETAVMLQRSDAAKAHRANVQLYLPNYQYAMDHPVHYGYAEGAAIQTKHLLVVSIYCKFDILQRRVSETYRKISDSEPLCSVKQRHTNYHHFARCLRETVQVFGTKYIDGGVRRVYHGIDQQMLFDSTLANIFGPLSTTTEFNVAVQFSTADGLVLDLIPQRELKYFWCDWLSAFPSEREILFCGGVLPINFVRILNAKSGMDYSVWINALRIIDTMTAGTYFMKDPSDVHKIKQLNTFDTLSLKVAPLSVVDKVLCLRLIHHELNRNGCCKYQRLQRLDPYADRLLHQICLNKTKVSINWSSMNVDVLRKCDRNDDGYIGYLFLRSLFCQERYEALRLNTIHALFPNVLELRVHNLSIIDSRFINDVLYFISNTRTSKINYFEFGISVEYNEANLQQQMEHFKPQFDNVGFNMFVARHRGLDIQIIVVRNVKRGRLYSHLLLENNTMIVENSKQIEFLSNKYSTSHSQTEPNYKVLLRKQRDINEHLSSKLREAYQEMDALKFKYDSLLKDYQHEVNNNMREEIKHANNGRIWSDESDIDIYDNEHKVTNNERICSEINKCDDESDMDDIYRYSDDLESDSDSESDGVGLVCINMYDDNDNEAKDEEKFQNYPIIKELQACNGDCGSELSQIIEHYVHHKVNGFCIFVFVYLLYFLLFVNIIIFCCL